VRLFHEGESLLLLGSSALVPVSSLVGQLRPLHALAMFPSTLKHMRRAWPCIVI
jgi:hypothetical protein